MNTENNKPWLKECGKNETYCDILKHPKLNDQGLYYFFSTYSECDKKTIIKLLDKYSKINQWHFDEIRNFCKSLNKKQIIMLMLFCEYFFRVADPVYYLRREIIQSNLSSY